MTTAIPLDIWRAPLVGSELIEASAGTGKTWTICALTLRLLLERQLPIESILIVTYTRAATADLRRRVRQRLVEALIALSGDNDNDYQNDDAMLAELLRRWPSGEPRLQAQARLALAIESFDQAAIFTIHGFCQRVLAERAFESSRPFDAELMTDETPLVAACVRDVWRRQMATATPLWAGWLLSQVQGPAALHGELRGFLNRPYLQRRAPVPATDSARAEADFISALTIVKCHWPSVRDDVMRLFEAALAAKALNGGTYRTTTLATLYAALDALATSAWPTLDLPEKLELLTPAKLAEKTNKGKAALIPDHPFFVSAAALLAAHTALTLAYAARLAQLRFDALAAVELALQERKRDSGRMAFDDLLGGLAEALHGLGAAALTAAVRGRWQAALIDEFQDADPIQYDIFSALFKSAELASELALYFVGDPKQAIYGFRGADVAAYLEARRAATGRHLLSDNYRSDPPLIRAVNALFARAEPFLDVEVGYTPATWPATGPEKPRDHLEIDGEDNAAPLTLWFMGRDEGSAKAVTKAEAQKGSARATAAEVARLLNRAAVGEARMVSQRGARPLHGGDIAILVHDRFHASAHREALDALGIASVTFGQDSVFASPEAAEIERLLLAIAEPGREPLVRAAYATDVLGVRGDEFGESRANAWEARLQRCHDWHALARSHGFMRMWRQLLAEENVVARLLARPDGERRLTNLQHLAELLQQIALDEGLDVGGLARRLAAERDAGAGEGMAGEDKQLRLESDARRVRILTIHSAKGLEFPIVFCPSLWNAKLRADKAPVVRFHDPASGAAVLDFGSADMAAARQLALREEFAESLRLAYVALTRARHRCVVVCGNIKDAERSALAWLLHGPAVPPEVFAALEAHFAAGEAALREDLERLQSRCADLRVLPLPDEEGIALAIAESAGRAAVARRFTAHVPAAWRVASFSGWLAQAHAWVTAEQPDHDGLVEISATLAATQVATTAAPLAPRPNDQSIFAFPRGARPGTLIHALFEHCDFAAPAQTSIESMLREAGYEVHWRASLLRLLTDVVTTPLDANGLSLSAVARRRLDELEFSFPLAAVTPSQLAAAIGSGQGADGLLMERVAALSFGAAQGFMKGFMDLVFEHDGRWYIVDYKSNWLGPTVDAYAPALLAEAMAGECYDLQALLYTVALVQALRLRQPGFDYVAHFGGVHYLFVRGMGPATGTQRGVYSWRPSADLVDRVGALLLRLEGIVA
jgi:exodeoxyribonuclease V beta subunit